MAAAARRRSARSTAKQEKEQPTSLEAVEVTVTIEELADWNESINILVYGPSGHGKTVLVSHIPGALILTTEKGVVSAKRTGSTAQLIRCPDWEHVVAAKAKADAERGPGDWVILDSLTKMQVLMIRWILRMRNEERSNRDLDIPAIQDHQKWQNYFKRFTDSLIDAPYNVVFTCTDMIKEDQDGETIVLPQIEGKDYGICNYVRAQTDVNIYYAITDKTPDRVPIRRALFQPFPPFVAPKDRYNVFGTYQDVPDGEYAAMAEFVKMIEEVA